MSAKFNMGMNMNMSIDLEKGNYNTFPPKHPETGTGAQNTTSPPSSVPNNRSICTLPGACTCSTTVKSKLQSQPVNRCLVAKNEPVCRCSDGGANAWLSFKIAMMLLVMGGMLVMGRAG